MNKLPICNFEKCKYNENLNCTKPNEYEKCSRGRIFTLTEKLYEKYPDDKEVWTLLQEVVRIGQAINKICDEFGIEV